ncbi:class I SAM-dependent methyltransferase [Streptomyces sp. NBC_00209]|uniref:class I SAM-dependent methyltransferase n=1 Tax=Streptomyces sp. NBC_00209 TaxID=2975682 RepID=UPI003256184D
MANTLPEKSAQDLSQQWWDGPRAERRREQTAVAETEQTVLRDFLGQFDVRGAAVLEVGGSMATAVAGLPDHRRWVSVDPLAQDSQGDGPEIIGRPVEDAGLERGAFDLVFSCNAFEHLSDLKKSMAAIHDALVPGGYVYAHFGPIWSGPDGHHMENISWEGRDLIFWRDNPIPHWTHLLLEPEEMTQMLEEYFAPGLVRKIVNSVHHDDWINRRFYEDYLEAFREADLTLVSLEGQHVVDYPSQYPDGPYRHPAFTGLLGQDPELVLNHRFGPKYRNFRCRDMRVVLRRPKGTSPSR